MFTSLSLALFRAQSHNVCTPATIMKSLSVLLFALVAALSLPNQAKAQFVLDTGTPTGSSLPILNINDSYAAEFSANAGQTLTLFSAYLTPNTGGTTFLFDIYSSLRTTSSRVSPVYTISGTYTAAGWNSSVANFTIPTTGDYWLAIQGVSGSAFDVPTESSTTTGTAPAIAFATAGTSTDLYSVSTAAPVGLQVTATPEPSAWALALLAVGGFVYLRRRSLRQQ